MNLKNIRTLAPRRLLTAALVAIGLTAIGGVASVIAQTSFPPSLERQLWKSLGPWGNLLNNTPSNLEVAVLDEDSQPVYEDFAPFRQVFESQTPGGGTAAEAEAAFETEFAALAPGECTFSHAGDYDGAGPQWRQCKAVIAINGTPTQVAVPPPPGSLLNPTALAVDGTRVYVADEFNHRIQVFDFFGNVTNLTFPIGNGIPGTEPYNYPYLGGISGHQLSAPNGIALDGSYPNPARKLLIADGGNGRVAIFKNTGSPAFLDTNGAPLHVSLPTGVSGEPAKPSQIAITPGATVQPPDTNGLADNGRIVVTDWTHCYVFIFDSKFELVNSLPSWVNYSRHAPGANGAYQADRSACLNPDTGYIPGPGEFSTVTGLAVDASGRIYVADHAQNVVQVFDRDGGHLGWIGRPGAVPSPGDLLGPVGVTIDHLGRLGVTDAGHARVAFYTVDFPLGAPVATFQFQLDTTVAVDDFPMGLAEQWGPGPLPTLDPKGRFLATDPLRRRVLRFELPELGIVNQAADNGKGSFGVAVPFQKASSVQNVTTDVSGVNATPSAATTTTPAPVNIPPGEVVNYTFTFSPRAPSPAATFTITATGDGGLAVAPSVTALARAACKFCDATHVVYNDPPPSAGPVVATPVASPTGPWYGRRVFVRVTPTGRDSATVSEILWYYRGQAALIDGSGLNVTPLVDGSVDIRVRVAGTTDIFYRAVDGDGNVGPLKQVTVNVDLDPPQVHFLNWTPRTGVAASGLDWHNVNVTGDYVVRDPHSGSTLDVQSDPNLPDGSISFTTEGRLQSKAFGVPIIDRVGHETFVKTALASGGRFINIDKTPPTLVVSVPANRQLVATGQDAVGGFAEINLADYIVTASDPLLGDGSAGSGDVLLTDSGVASLTNPLARRFPVGATNWTFTATDAAGNSSTQLRTVTVVKAPSTVTYQGATVVTRGQSLNVKALVTPEFAASGSVTFTLGSQSVVASIDNLVATASIPGVTIDGGLRTLSLSYSGDAAVAPSASSATITVISVPTTTPTITWNTPADIVYGIRLSGAQLNAVGSVAGTLTYSPAAGTLLEGGASQTLSVTFTPADTINYDTASATVSITVLKATPTIVWNTPADIFVGTLLGAPQLNATASVPGSFIYSPPAGTLLPAGSGQVLAVNFTPTETRNYNTARGSVPINVLSNRPPTCSVATGGEIWPPNHKRFFAAPITGVSDPDGDRVEITVTGIVQDEPVDTTGDGQFSPDGYGVGTSTAWVRAERMGSGDGRVYEIRFTATDGNGGKCDGHAYYTVPKSQGQPWEVINSGLTYDSTKTVPMTRNK